MNKIKGLKEISLLGLLLLFCGTGMAAGLDSQTSREGSVTVKVTPKDISAGTKNWDFEVTLSTHAVALDQDMTRVAVLIADSGRPQFPLAWLGDPPGGHHRNGTLRFQPPLTTPRQIELQINGIGGVTQRGFRWQTGK